MLGAFSDGEWAWMRYPAPIGKQKEWRTLWLTRMPTKTFADAEELLLYATLQPVDTVMGAIRDRVLSYARPINRAAQGRSFRKNYTNPQTAMAESSIHLLGRNYALMSKDGEDDPRAAAGPFHLTARPSPPSSTSRQSWSNFDSGLPTRRRSPDGGAGRPSRRLGPRVCRFLAAAGLARARRGRRHAAGILGSPSRT